VLMVQTHCAKKLVMKKERAIGGGVGGKAERRFEGKRDKRGSKKEEGWRKKSVERGGGEIKRELGEGWVGGLEDGRGGRTIGRVGGIGGG